MDDLLTELVGAGVSVVIDVRETPWSYVPAYRAATLRVVLAERGIRYLHAQFAGNPKWIRQSARSHEECLAMYRAHLNAHPRIAERLRALLEELSREGEKGCLLCYERHPEDCHRHILLEVLGLEARVEHLGPDGAPRFVSR